MRSKKVLVFWTREEKTGIESLSSVPESSRFVGAATPVLFSGDKKFYPAKVLMISDDDEALESKAEEVAREILNNKLEQQKAAQLQKRGRKKVVNPTAASERDVAVALGGKPPVPKNLQPAHKAAQKASKEDKTHHSQGQDNLDHAVMGTLRKNLFNAEKSKVLNVGSHQGGNEESEDKEGHSSESDDEHGNQSGSGSDEEKDSFSETLHHHWCGCTRCNILQKYDAPNYRNFLHDLSNLFQCKEEKKLFLELKEFPSEVKQVELVAGSKVLIPATIKEQIKVDFRNKPTSLIKETLFALYGKDTFRVLPVTARGQKNGTYGIPDHVLTAVHTFVKRNVSKEQQMKTSEFNHYINKRIPDWRKTPSPKVIKKTSKKKNKKATSTSPIKVTPFDLQDSPSKCEKQNGELLAANFPSNPPSPLQRESPSKLKNQKERRKANSPYKHSPAKGRSLPSAASQPRTPVKSTTPVKTSSAHHGQFTAASPRMKNGVSPRHTFIPPGEPSSSFQRPSAVPTPAPFPLVHTDQRPETVSAMHQPFGHVPYSSSSYDANQWGCGYQNNGIGYQNNARGYQNNGSGHQSNAQGNHFNHMPWGQGNDYWLNGPQIEEL